MPYNNDLSWIKQGEGLTGNDEALSPGGNSGILNRPLAELLENDDYLLAELQNIINNSVHNPINLLTMMYPVGSIYTNFTNNTNPATLFGDLILTVTGTYYGAFGVWTPFGQGRVLVGDTTVGGGDLQPDDNAELLSFTAGTYGGEKNHVLTQDELPTGTILNQAGALAIGAGATHDTVGTDAGHNNLQPYVTAYMWRRVN